MKVDFPKIMFISAIAAMVFGYGFLTGTMQIFPYQVIKEAKLAFSALREVSSAQDVALENLEFWDETGITSPVYQTYSTGAGMENIFVLGNDLTYKNDQGDQPLLAWITNRDGELLHTWTHPGEIWAPLKGRTAFGDTWRSYPIGAYVYPNGDLLVSYQGVNTFPIGMGLAKFDKDSNLIWKTNGLYHHWFSVSDDGDIFVAGTAIASSPMKIGDREKLIFCSDQEFPYDTVVILGADGQLKKEINLFEVFDASDLTGVFNNSSAAPVTLQSCDPMHLNDIRVLSQEMAPEFPDLSVGDLLVSFRSLNAIGILDPNAERFKRFHMGTTQHQHSPRYFRDNKVFVFDNHGGNATDSATRVVSIDLLSEKSDVVFPRKNVSRPDKSIISKVAGYIDIHKSGTRMLVAFSEQGLIWEVDIASGEVLWEFVNTHTVNDRPGRVAVFVADYVDAPSFEMNGGRR